MQAIVALQVILPLTSLHFTSSVIDSSTYVFSFIFLYEETFDAIVLWSSGLGHGVILARLQDGGIAVLQQTEGEAIYEVQQASILQAENIGEFSCDLPFPLEY
jgi:hypothetical protein